MDLNVIVMEEEGRSVLAMAIADDHEDNGDHEKRRKGYAQRQEDRHVRYR